jgi:hypothetical protein
MKKTPLCFDNGGETFDRYTLIYGKTNERGRVFWYIGSSQDPLWPMGFWQHGEIAAVNTMSRGRVSFKHLGKRVPFESLPQAVQDTYRRSYNESVKPRTVAQVVEVDSGYVFTYNVRPLGRLVKYTAHWVSKEPYPFAPSPNLSEFIGHTPSVRGRKMGWRNLAPYIVHRFLREAQIQGAWHDQR